MERTYFQYNPWWEDEVLFEDLIERPIILKQLESYINNNKSIIIITGLRRVGKTSLIRLIIKGLIQKGTNPFYIFYVSLDDYLLSSKSIIEIIDDYRKIHKISIDKKVFLFLDEIAYKENFQLQLKNIYDKHNAKVFASSSNSSILRDRKAYLTGREMAVEILPLDFTEYLLFKGIKIKKRDENLLERYFEEFLETGGMPEYVMHYSREYLQALIDDIIYKDIIAFHSIKNKKIITDFFILLMERAGKQVSINKVANILGISPDTSKRYLKMFEDTYLIHPINRYGKTNERILFPKKIYAADLGIKNFITGFRDKGSIFENYLFLKIKKEEPEYIYKNGIEIDFYLKKKGILIESKYGSELNKKQKQLFDSFKAKNKMVLTNFRDIDHLSSLIHRKK